MKKELTLIILIIIQASITFAQSVNEKQELKKRKLIEKRYIHPSSRYLSFSGGWGFISNFIDDSNNILRSSYFPEHGSFLPAITYEHGIKNNYFVEISYSYIENGTTFKTEFNNISSSSYVPHYNNHDIQLGIGYRVITKNNYNLINLHTGLFLGIADADFNNLPKLVHNTSLELGDNNQILVRANATSFSRTTLGPYLGLSKEIRITSKFRFLIKYTHRFGLVNQMQGEVKLSSPTNTYNEPTTFRLNGSGAFITLGVKFMVFEKLLNN